MHNSESWGGYTKIFHYANPFGEDAGSPVEGTWTLAPEAERLWLTLACNGDCGPIQKMMLPQDLVFDDHYVFVQMVRFKMRKRSNMA